MPGLFSRRSKGKGPAQITSIKGYNGAISSADIDRLGLSSPTPSTADAHILPNVPTKDDLPTPPPKDSAFNLVSPSHQLNTSKSRQTSNTLPHQSRPAPAIMNEFGQMASYERAQPATIASSSTSNDKSYLQPASHIPSTAHAGPHPTVDYAQALHALSLVSRNLRQCP